MRILITGATGFVGRHLAALLAAERGHAVHGMARQARPPLHAADLHDGPRLESVLAEVRPEWVFHLAGYANTGRSFHEPEKCWRDNLDGTRNFYDAIHRSGLNPRILFVSTGLVYGDADGACDESAVLRPASPYAASKAAADLLGYQVSRSPGLDVLCVRLFNQIGPGQSADYAIANFARQIAAAERGEQPPILRTGDLSASRDLTDVRDVVAAFRLLIAKGVRGEVYNAGRGRTWRIQDVLDKLVTLARVPMAVHSARDTGRATDTAVTRADPRKLQAATGWQCRYELEQTLADVLDFWRAAPPASSHAGTP